MKKLYIGEIIKTRNNGVCNFCGEKDKITYFVEKNIECGPSETISSVYDPRIKKEIVMCRNFTNNNITISLDICADCVKQINEQIKEK